MRGAPGIMFYIVGGRDDSIDDDFVNRSFKISLFASELLIFN